MASVSSDIIARYAADAAREVDGVQDLVESTLPRHNGVRVVQGDGSVRVELHVTVEWGASIPAVGVAVQKRVAEYLSTMLDIELQGVDVVVDEIGAVRTVV
jgi:uncharacterized alkaline shock family protein YloU